MKCMIIINHNKNLLIIYLIYKNLFNKKKLYKRYKNNNLKENQHIDNLIKIFKIKKENQQR